MKAAARQGRPVRGQLGRRYRSLIALALLSAATLGVSVTPAMAERHNILRIGATFEPTSLNPFVDFGGFYPWALTYDFLTAELVPGPGYAESWTTSADGTVWTFKVPVGSWSDGQPATARDAAFTFNYLLDSVGLPDELTAGWNSTGALKDVLKSAEAPDDQTLVLTLNYPSQWPIMTGIFIVPEHIWKDVSYADALAIFANDPPIVGSGPFVVTEFVPGQYTKLVANDKWRKGRPAVDEVILQVFSTDDAIVTALKSGEVDIALSVPAAQVASLNDPDVKLISAVTGERIELVFNTASDTQATSLALQDPAFRDALGYALDKQALVDKVRQGHATVGVTLPTPEIPIYFSPLSDIARTFSLDTAKQKLEAAGYVDSNGDGTREDKQGKELDLRLFIPAGGRSSADIASSAQFVVDWYGQVGINLSATALEKTALRSLYAPPAEGGGDWDISIDTYWPFAQPIFAFEQALTSHVGGDNWASWSNAQFDGLWSDLSRQVTPEAAAPIVDQLARLVYTEAPYHVLYYANQVQAYRTDRYEGWTRRPSEDSLLAYGYYGQDTLELLKPIAVAGESPGDSAAPSVAASSAPGETPGSNDSGSNTALIVGGVLVVLLVGGGVLYSRRKRAD